MQKIENLIFAVFDVAPAVRVFNAQHKLAAPLAGEGSVEQCDVRGADVRIAGRRGCDSDADGHD